ncbi:MAG: FAD binding domain-containing protein [Pseudomonadota bacterium]
MSLHPQFARPRNVDQAVEILSSLTTGATIIAGGQEIMPHINYGVLAPSVYVDIGSISALRGVSEADGAVHIGALTVHRDLEDDHLLKGAVPLLAYAASQVGGGWQVRNRGTVGGNIVSMHPLYDILPSLLALGAEVDVLSGSGESRVALADLMRDTGHGLGSETLLVRVVVKPMTPGVGWAYEKLKISEGGYGSANAAAIVTMNGDAITDLRVVVGAVTELPLDVSDALSECRGQSWSDRLGETIERKTIGEVTNPLSDHQGDGDWRRAMAGVVARRAVGAAIARTRGDA